MSECRRIPTVRFSDEWINADRDWRRERRGTAAVPLSLLVERAARVP